MSDNEIRIIIAQACGLPPLNYPNDLNAIHEAEKTLTASEGVKFRLRLMKNSDGVKATFKTVEAAMCHATAHQRAEAFLKAKQLWKP